MDIKKFLDIKNTNLEEFTFNLDFTKNRHCNMKYILRTLWLIGCIPVYIFTVILSFVTFLTYPLIGAFYFIKTGSCENGPFIPISILIYVNEKYKKLLKYINENE